MELELLYELEPDLQAIAEQAFRRKRRRMSVRLLAYEEAKRNALYLVGWQARNPRLRNSGAWECFFRHVIEGLRI